MQPKRILISLLVVILLTFCMITAVSAAEIPAPSFTVNATVSEDKATVEVSVTVEAYATALDSQTAHFTYDTNALELVSYELVGAYAEMTQVREEAGKLTISSYAGLEAGGELLRATFNVKDVCEVPAVKFSNIVIAANFVDRANVSVESAVLDAHIFDEGVVTEPNCLEGGYTTYTCYKCSEPLVADYTDALGHTPGAEADCENDQTCAREDCDYVFAPAIGHKAGPAATCTTAQVCVNGCGKVYMEALGHLEGPDANCTDAKVCLRDCGHVYADALGHIPGEEADCENDQLCTREGCGAVLAEKLGHVPGTEATCTTNQVCTREGCGKELVAALGHKHNVEAATCEVAKVCSVCKVVDTPALGHNYGEWVLTTEPTRKADGVNTKTCARCNGTITEPVVLVSSGEGWLYLIIIVVFLVAAGFIVYWLLLKDDIKEKGGVRPYCKSVFGKKESTESVETTNETPEENSEE